MTQDEYDKRAQEIVREEFEAAVERIANRSAKLIAEKLVGDFVAKAVEQGELQCLKH